MSANPVFHPRFSARNSFQDIPDARDKQYSTKKGRELQNAPKSRQCYAPNHQKDAAHNVHRAIDPQFIQKRAQARVNPFSQPSELQQLDLMVPQSNSRIVRPNLVEKTRMDRTRRDPTPQDRDYWRSKQVVAQDQSNQLNGKGQSKDKSQSDQEGDQSHSDEHEDECGCDDGCKSDDKSLSDEQMIETQAVRWQVAPYVPRGKEVKHVEQVPKSQDREYWKSNQTVNVDGGKVIEGVGYVAPQVPNYGKVQQQRQVQQHQPRQIQQQRHVQQHQTRQVQQTSQVEVNACPCKNQPAVVQPQAQTQIQRKPRQVQNSAVAPVKYQAQAQRREPINTLNREQLIRMGEREAQLQKEKRGRQQILLNGMNIELPAEAFNGGEFTIELPADADVPESFEVQTRPSYMALDTTKELKGLVIGEDVDAEQNRSYWGGKTVVAKPKKSFISKNFE